MTKMFGKLLQKKLAMVNEDSKHSKPISLVDDDSKYSRNIFWAEPFSLRSGWSDESYRDFKRHLPKPETFSKTTLPLAISAALHDVWSDCITYNSKVEHRYSFCKHCQSIQFNIERLAHSLRKARNSSAEISIRRKMIDLADNFRLMQVTITWPGIFSQKFEVAHNMNETWSDSNLFLVDIGQGRAYQARKWFIDCEASHQCHIIGCFFLPRRLVFVGDKHSRPRVIETNESKREDIQYAALSYCWGREAVTFKTTRENIDYNKLGIPPDDLPKTIQDAIHVCRIIGLKYLWVDALCIIQNDICQQDWYEQSGQMRQIYSNAQLTITIDDAPGCNVGFWDNYTSDWRILKEEQNLNHLQSWIRPTETQTPDILSTRGWALQERILSHRTIHFSTNGIRWECDHCCRTEDGKNSLDFLGLSFRAFRLFNSAKHHESLSCPKEDDENTIHITEFLSSGSWRSIHCAWTIIVEAYSQRELTDPRDKLSAISGLADLVLDFEGHTAESYLAGLWKDDLVEGLLWYVVGPKTPKRSSTYIAPTWSWASVQFGVKYFQERYQFSFESDVKVSSANCTPMSSDLTGRVRSGYLELQGELVPVELAVVSCSAPSATEYTGINGGASRTILGQVVFVRHLFRDENLRQKAIWYEVLCDERMAETATCSYSHDLPPEFGRPRSEKCRFSNISSSQTTYFCLSIGTMVDQNSGGRRHWWLLLQKIRGENTYQRVGVGYFQYLFRDFTLFKLKGQKKSVCLI